MEVLLEAPYTTLRPLLQRELGDNFMVSAGGEPDAAEAIIVTRPDPERIGMLREAYPLSRIFVLESSEPPPPTAYSCFEAGANGLLVCRNIFGLGVFVRALVRRLYGFPTMSPTERGNSTKAEPFHSADEPGGTDVG